MTYHVNSSTQRKIDSALGFPVRVISSSTHEIHGERRTVYTCQRPRGRKNYQVFMGQRGNVWS